MLHTLKNLIFWNLTELFLISTVNAVFNSVLEKEDDLSSKTLQTRSEHVIKYKWKSDSAASFQSNVSNECIELIFHTMDRAEAEGKITADVVSKVCVTYVRYCKNLLLPLVYHMKLKLVLRNLGDVL